MNLRPVHRVASTSPIGRTRGEGGSATIWMIGVTVCAFLMVGLVLDGGVMLRARSDAFATAASAARVGAQQLDQDAAVEGQSVLDPTTAKQAALDYLAAKGVTGAATVSNNSVTVTVTTQTDLQLLEIVGGGPVAFTATATVRAIKVAPP